MTNLSINAEQKKKKKKTDILKYYRGKRHIIIQRDIKESLPHPR